MKIVFSKQADKHLEKLDRQSQKKITDYLKEIAKLDNPRMRGKLLVGNLAGYWRYRVGDYRIICEIHDDKIVIIVIDIGHRKEIYETT